MYNINIDICPQKYMYGTYTKIIEWCIWYRKLESRLLVIFLLLFQIYKSDTCKIWSQRKTFSIDRYQPHNVCKKFLILAQLYRNTIFLTYHDIKIIQAIDVWCLIESASGRKHNKAWSQVTPQELTNYDWGNRGRVTSPSFGWKSQSLLQGSIEALAIYQQS